VAIQNYIGGNTLSSGTAIPNTILRLTFENGRISNEGIFSGDLSVVGVGFTGDLNGRTGGEFSGAFFDAADYGPATDAPAEVGGTFSITDSMGETLSGGFLGAKR
jgi:hypothetical protein